MAVRPSLCVMLRVTDLMLWQHGGFVSCNQSKDGLMSFSNAAVSDHPVFPAQPLLETWLPSSSHSLALPLPRPAACCCALALQRQSDWCAPLWPQLQVQQPLHQPLAPPMQTTRL